MALPFKLGAGGKIGSGRQWMSWIDLEELCGIILHSIRNPNVSGPVNAVAPGAVTNKEFTRILGDVLHRPTLFPVPAFAARLMLGEMADELLLASQKVEPAKLRESGFVFKHPVLESALRASF